ncbi:MAG: polyprenyl synthetase family protein [Candidatus Hydrogenedentes bacterium]|nr:polyprenyl synthetase family protein [Candidatus Hydrogenedentota bacterium]
MKLTKDKTMIQLKEIYKPIEDQLKKIEKIVQEIWQDVLSLVDIEHTPALKAKGKLIRPAVCLLSAGALGKKNLEKYIPMATAFEILHLASLTHDDVVDGADFRRGGLTLNRLWSNHAAVLGGDYLVARALEMLGQYKSMGLIKVVLKSIREMAEGELKFFNKKLEEYSIEDCLELSLRKTGMLFVCSAIGPTLIENSTNKQSFYNYGKNIGIAFQLIDDLLDFTQDSEVLGKPTLNDLEERKITLPLVMLWHKLNNAEKKFITNKIGATLTKKDKDKIQYLFNKYGIETQVKSFTNSLKDKAIGSLKKIRNSHFKISLIDLAQFIIERKN